jgi:hypothetical protein
MPQFTIYHVPEIKKIGCTEDLDRRSNDIEYRGKYKLIPLEYHTDRRIASDREKELQREYGYEVDTSSFWSIQFGLHSPEARAKVGKKVSKRQKGKLPKSLNTKKAKQNQIIGKRKQAGRPMSQWTKDGELIRRWEGYWQICLQHNKPTAGMGSIMANANGRTASAYGYVWKYDDV